MHRPQGPGTEHIVAVDVHDEGRPRGADSGVPGCPASPVRGVHEHVQARIAGSEPLEDFKGRIAGTVVDGNDLECPAELL